MFEDIFSMDISYVLGLAHYKTNKRKPQTEVVYGGTMFQILVTSFFEEIRRSSASSTTLRCLAKNVFQEGAGTR